MVTSLFADTVIDVLCHISEDFYPSFIVKLRDPKITMHMAHILHLYIYFKDFITSKIFTQILLYTKVTIFVSMQYPILQ